MTKKFDPFRAAETAARIRENIARARSGLDPIQPEPLYGGEDPARKGRTVTSVGAMPWWSARNWGTSA